MKRFLALLALVLGVVSCQTEPEGLDVIVGGEVDTVVTVTIPEAETRANSSSLGVFSNDILDDPNVTMRYILEIYYGDESRDRLVDYSDGTEVAFPVRLVPDRHYNFVVWADVVTKVDTATEFTDVDNHYDTEDLEAITLNGEWDAMDETRDAFTGYFNTATDGDKTPYNGSKAINIPLIRPFAKLRVITTDFDELAKYGIKATSGVVSYSSDYSGRASFNACTGKASDAITTFLGGSYDIVAYTSETNDARTIFSDYIFASTDGDIVKFDLDIYDLNGGRIKYNNFNTDIRVKRNYITTIKGDVLTDGGKVTVTVNPGFEEDEIIKTYVDSADDLQDIINNAADDEETNIVIGGNIDLGDLLNAGILSTRASTSSNALVTIAEGKVITLDLNGCTVTVPFVEGSTTNHFYAFDNKGTFTIKDSKGNGQIIARGIFNYGTMTLKSGIINACDGNGGYGVRNYEGAEFIMDGGSIVTSYEDGDIPGEGYDASPVRVDEGATATFNGGTIDNISNYTVAIDNYGETTINGGTFTTIHTTIANSATMTINGGSFTCNGLEGITAHALWAAAGTTTINGGTFDGKDNYNGFNVDASKGAVVNIKGGEFLSAHSGSLYGEGTISVMGGEFFDDPSKFVDDDYTAVKGENGKWNIVRKPDVAKIGEVGYTSLAKAVDAAKEGETIVFIADVEQADGVIITDKNITIDLNEKTFTVTNGANTNNRNFKVDGSSVVTIKNGTMVAQGNITSGAYGTLRTEGAANVTLENVKLYSYRGSGLNVKVCTGTTVTINNSEIYSQYGGGVEAAGGTVVLNDVTIDQKGVYSGNAWCSVAIGVNGNGKVTVNSGDYSASAISTDANATQGTWVAYVMSSGGTLDIKGGTFNGVVAETAAAANACGLICADRAAVVEIHGGTFNSNGAILDMRNNVGSLPNPKATLFGGTFSADPRVSGLYSSNLITVAAGYKVVENNGRWAVVVDPVAKIGDVEYATLQEAFNVGGEITLLRNVAVAETVVLAEGKTVVLDLNGKTLSAADKNVIRNDGGNLTIMNGTVTRTGDVVGYSVNNASGEITVEDATITCGLYTSGSKLTATNANISHEQSTRHAIYAWNCEVTINSGTFHNDNAGNATLMASGSSVVTINGGTFSIADGRSTLGWTSSMIDQNGTAQVIVKGGLFNGGFRINSADTTLTIEGGEFNTNNGSAFTDYSGTKVVKGGKFTDAGAQNWAKKYIAEGYEMDANGQVVAK